MGFNKFALLALALLPFSYSQTSTDFESGWDQTAWPVYAPDCNQGGTVALDSTTAHSGKNSIKVTSPGGYCGHIFFGTTNVPKGDVYVRVWLKATNALTSNHVTFITMPDSAQGTNKHLRIGGQNQILMYNRESDDATLPNLSPQGVASSVALPTNAWECFEYHLGTDGSIESWLNSAAIAGITTKGNPNADQWTKSTIIPKITGVYFGWESYGGDTNTFWYDDVAISSSRVGCSGSGGGSPSSVSSTSLKTTTSSSPTTSSKASTTGLSTLTTSIKTTTTTTSTTKAATTTTAGTGNCAAKWAQCGGTNWTGATCCISSTCTFSNAWYSQCL